MNLPRKLHNKLEQRIQNDSLRTLSPQCTRVDFSSNDYLGFAKDSTLFSQIHTYVCEGNITENGSAGSRLLTGNHPLYAVLEEQLAKFYESEMALVFTSGYAANLGLLSSIVLRGDIVLYDQLCHASIRDGITLSNGRAYKFKHNDLNDLESLLNRVVSANTKESTVYVVTESVFSMDGDQPDLQKMAAICAKFNAKLIVDEAHAVGVFGNGLVPSLGLCELVFARVITFGKGIGSHGAAVLGSKEMKNYLVNFARSFIYSTALDPHTLATLICAHKRLEQQGVTADLHRNISFFVATAENLSLPFIPSESAIQCIRIHENTRIKQIANTLNQRGYDVRPILSPTVPKGTERLRFCLHTFNTLTDIKEVLELLKTLLRSHNE
ncbi:aminotransferase class I/II-fold pyridoxal phosphate-dependent enzyme [Flavobacteriaceae bacterium F08102]|nr:aminotransferase class I/II-fold pyridoxal phosphate-dependent enzyme [Flavobacteriaceae bacterium F08102]